MAYNNYPEMRFFNYLGNDAGNDLVVMINHIHSIYQNTPPGYQSHPINLNHFFLGHVIPDGYVDIVQNFIEQKLRQSRLNNFWDFSYAIARRLPNVLELTVH